MPYIVASIVVILLACAGWYIVWSLIKDPEAPFEFRGVAFSHDINPEESLSRIEALASNVEVIFREDVMALLGISDIEADIFLEYLVEQKKLERHGEGEMTVYVLA